MATKLIFYNKFVDILIKYCKKGSKEKRPSKRVFVTNLISSISRTGFWGPWPTPNAITDRDYSCKAFLPSITQYSALETFHSEIYWALRFCIEKCENHVYSDAERWRFQQRIAGYGYFGMPDGGNKGQRSVIPTKKSRAICRQQTEVCKWRNDYDVF